jgi:hypothetical protein
LPAGALLQVFDLGLSAVVGLQHTVGAFYIFLARPSTQCITADDARFGLDAKSGPVSLRRPGAAIVPLVRPVPDTSAPLPRAPQFLLRRRAHLSQSELYALRAKLISLWNPPAAVSAHPDQYVVSIRIRLARNHRLVGQPVVLTRGHGPLFEATRDSAVRALFQAQPYSMLSLTTYDQWKEIDINFDPREVFGG